MVVTVNDIADRLVRQLLNLGLQPRRGFHADRIGQDDALGRENDEGLMEAMPEVIDIVRQLRQLIIRLRPLRYPNPWSKRHGDEDEQNGQPFYLTHRSLFRNVGAGFTPPVCLSLAPLVGRGQGEGASLVPQGTRDQLLVYGVHNKTEDLQRRGSQQGRLASRTERYRHKISRAVNGDPGITRLSSDDAAVGEHHLLLRSGSDSQIRQQIAWQLGQRGAGINHQFDLPRIGRPRRMTHANPCREDAHSLFLAYHSDVPKRRTMYPRPACSTFIIRSNVRLQDLTLNLFNLFSLSLRIPVEELIQHLRDK